jgi:hypothetical protein
MSMKEQLSLAATGFERHSKTTRRTKFLLEMDRIVPWKRLRKIVRPFYYQEKGVGRRPIDLERMLRIYFLQHWFNLSDPAVEEALYDMISMRAFARVDLGNAAFSTRRRSASFGTSSRNTIWARGSLPRSIAICPTAASRSAAAQSSTQRSFMRPARPRLTPASAIPSCTRPGRATNGTLA